MLDFRPVPSPDKWGGLLRRRKKGRASYGFTSPLLVSYFPFDPPFLPLSPLFPTLLPVKQQQQLLLMSFAASWVIVECISKFAAKIIFFSANGGLSNGSRRRIFSLCCNKNFPVCHMD